MPVINDTITVTINDSMYRVEYNIGQVGKTIKILNVKDSNGEELDESDYADHLKTMYNKIFDKELSYDG